MPFPENLRVHPKQKPNGFTLVELLVVLAIMSLAAVLFIGASGNSSGVDKKTEIVELESAIAFTRKTAILQATTKELDMAPYAVSLTPQLGESKKLIFYADGSSNGGVIAADSKRLFTVRWIDGAINR
ncbi:MAG: prepilin-type N-terminal cleavage/methylation domain-containing protein [Parasphingorhabdus sp.]|uniref:pilus assembly FimT family protein n=1 Tax=Parasphingorhabdus sp. TaxID=2709688 RepID=UPI003296DCC2